MNEQPIRVYELKEVANILKINIRVLRRYIKEGKIEASKIGRKYVIKAEDLDNYLARNSKGINNTSTDAITEEEKALLEAMLTKALEGKLNIELLLKNYLDARGKTLTEEEMEQILDNLLSLQAIKKENFRGIVITSKMNLLNSYKKTPTGYEVELNKDLVKQFKENMLINVEIEKK